MEGAEALTLSICHVQVYFDMNVGGESQGRIVVQLFDDVPIGSRRFMDLAEGHEGISYQLSKVDTIAPVCPRTWKYATLFCAQKYYYLSVWPETSALPAAFPALTDICIPLGRRVGLLCVGAFI